MNNKKARITRDGKIKTEEMPAVEQVDRNTERRNDKLREEINRILNKTCGNDKDKS